VLNKSKGVVGNSGHGIVLVKPSSNERFSFLLSHPHSHKMVRSYNALNILTASSNQFVCNRADSYFDFIALRKLQSPKQSAYGIEITGKHYMMMEKLEVIKGFEF